jgi:hypothetical protein
VGDPTECQTASEPPSTAWPTSTCATLPQEFKDEHSDLSGYGNDAGARDPLCGE